jgi:hypothetical protein
MLISRGRIPGIGIGGCQVISRASSLRLHARLTNRIVLAAIRILPNYRIAEAEMDTPFFRTLAYLWSGSLHVVS